MICYPSKCISYIISNEIFQVYSYLIHCSNDRRGRDRMVVGFTITYAINVYHDQSCEFEPRSWRDVLDTTLCDKVCR